MRLLYFVLFCIFLFLQYFDTVGWVFWPDPSPRQPILCWWRH